ncbi:MAG: polysaccharide biosynthesis protein [Clostridium sp.]
MALSFKHSIYRGFDFYERNIHIMPLFTVIYILGLYGLKMYRSVWRIAGIDEAIKVFMASAISCAVSIVFVGMGDQMRVEVAALAGVLIFIFTLGTRMSVRVLRRIIIYNEIKNNRNERVMIIGAGSSGNNVIDEMLKNEKSDMKPICFIDDNKTKRGKFLRGIRIEGNRFDIKRLVEEKKIDTIILAISAIDGKEKKKILEICQETKAKLKIVPGILDILKGKDKPAQVRNVDLKDLLGREEVVLDKKGVEGYIKDKTVLVTGGGGSIGSELCRQIVKHKPTKLIILDIYENNAYDIQNELLRKYKDLNLRVTIASVRDRHRLEKIFREETINVVFHAAAHKHVPLMEHNSEEAIKNNVVGTLNVAECAAKFKAEKFVLISTDKAVNPTNIMGATKRLCEMIIQGIDKESDTEYVAVRFGNVLGSNGSVIPLFKRQIEEGGPVTLTHKDITRYFMLIPEAAQLVLQAGAYAKGGEIFVLDMGESVRIYDLAKNLIKLSGYEPEKDIKIEITGLRPGEKLYEELLMNEEGLTSTENKKIFIGEPSDVEIKALKEEISEILVVALNSDKESLKKRMKKVVTTYIEPGEEKALEEVAASRERL